MNGSVSVLLLSYNHKNFLVKSIESVFNQYDFIYDLELLVLDDGSNDGSQEILMDLKKKSPIEMKVFLRSHEGVKAISKNLNFLISLASKKYISFLASDDFYLPDRFRAQLNIMEKNDFIQFVYANGLNMLHEKYLDNVHPSFVVDLLSSNNSNKLYDYVTSTTPLLFIQSVLVRSSFLKKFKPFNDKLIADDWVFNINCFKNLLDWELEFGFVNVNVFVRNILPNSTSNNFFTHFKRVSETAEIYIVPEKRSFYLTFYLTYIKLSLSKFQFKFFLKLFYRFFLLLLGSRNHNKDLCKF